MTDECDARDPAAADIPLAEDGSAEAAVRAAWRSCFSDIAPDAGESDTVALAESIAQRLRARTEGNVCRGAFRLYRFLGGHSAAPADTAPAVRTAGTAANVYPLRRR